MKQDVIFFQNLGCPKNLVDTETMLGISVEEGYVVSSNPESATVIVVNTCCFIEDAVKESIDTILELSRFKIIGKCRKLIVTGCLAQRYSRELKKAIPEIDILVGTGEYSSFSTFLSKIAQKKEILSPPGFINLENYPRLNSEPFFRAYLKIADGCKKRCSFCVIPQIRGPLRSVSISVLIKEAAHLVSNDVKELILVAQSLGDYGKDLNDRTSLKKLLISLMEIKKLEWIRLLYVYPEDLDRELIELFKEKKVCKYIDIPIQHANDRILKLMNRKTRKLKILKTIEELRKTSPNISIRTSVIVGYPSETKKDFHELMDFIKIVEFDHLGAFIFSRQENTPAYLQRNQIGKKVKEERYLEIMELQKNISRKKLQSKIGTTLKVLIEEKEGNLYFGRHEGQAPEIDGKVIAKGKTKIGTFSKVFIEDSTDYDLVGHITN